MVPTREAHLYAYSVSHRPNDGVILAPPAVLCVNMLWHVCKMCKPNCVERHINKSNEN